MRVFNQILRAGVSGAAMAACALPVAAWAQDTSGADTTATSDEIAEEQAIIVTGIRASLQGARARKRDAEQVVDSITAQDIGALPDRSVSEALQRVPGVTLQRTSDNRDPARLSGEGGGVFIRGLSFVRSEINGRDAFSAANGRALSFEDISSDLLSGVDVYKNPSADMIEGGIGGTIDLRTRKPFDAPGFVAAFSGDINYADLRKKSFMSGNALISDRWDTGLGEIGVLVSYSISNIGNRTDSISTGRYVPTEVSADDAAASGGALTEGDTVYIPNSMGYRRIDWSQKRTAFDGSLQWRPASNLTFTGEALISKATPHDLEYAMGDWASPNTYDPSYTYGSAGELVSGTAEDRQLNMDTRAGSQTKKTQDYSFNATWEPGDHWTISTGLQYVKSTSKVYSMTAYTGTDAAATFDFDYSGNTPYLSITPTDSSQSFKDKSAAWWYAAMDHLEDNEADEWAWRGDAEYAFHDGGFLKSIKAGARYTDQNAITRQTGYNWSLLSSMYPSSAFNAVYLDQTGYPGMVQNPDLPNQASLITFPDFFRGEAANPTTGLWFPSAGLVTNGTAYAYGQLQATITNGWGWSPLSDDYASSASGGGINNQMQTTWAGYLVARYGLDNSPIGRFDGNIGVRVVRTKMSAVGTAASVGTLSTACTASDCTDFNSAVSFIASGVSAGATSGKNSYTDILPSFNFRYFAADDLQIRVAASKGISRPSFAQLNPYTALSFSFASDGSPNGTGVNGSTTAFTGIAGNPNLKPTRALNLDLSFEYYYGRSNSLTLGLFYKDVKDYIFAGLVQQTYTSNDGQTLTFDVTQQTNGSHGTIKGAELAYTQFFDSLPGALSGLGFEGNVTYVDSTGGKNTAVNVFDTEQTTNAGLELPLEGMSKWSYNVAGIYEKYGISARVAYNWRSAYLLTTSAANINYPVWSDAYGQLDASFLVSVGDHFKIGLQGTNLLTSRTILRVGDPSLKPRYSWTETDRRVAMVVRTRF